MLLSYVMIWMVLYKFFLLPQAEMLRSYQQEEEALEYDYRRLTSSSEYIDSVRNTVVSAQETVRRFDWLNEGYDPNLVFLEHVSQMSDLSSLKLVEMVEIQKSAKDTMSYYTWNVAFVGNFGGILNFLNEIENSPKFLKIEKIEIMPRKEGTVINIVITGLKKLG